LVFVSSERGCSYFEESVARAKHLLGGMDVATLTATWRQPLNRGEWLCLGVAPEIFRKSEFPNERYASKGYVGATNYDAGLLANFLSAFHGLLPWNVMHDPAYYDKLLRPGLARPSSVQILNERDRENYRREVLKIGA
jgi:hypothetical protein